MMTDLGWNLLEPSTKKQHQYLHGLFKHLAANPEERSETLRAMSKDDATELIRIIEQARPVTSKLVDVETAEKLINR